MTTLDLAETPRARINYFYYFGKRSHWWHQTEAYAENVQLNTFVDGTPIPDVISRHFSVGTNFNYSLNEKSYWGFGGFWQTNQLKPKIDPRTEANPDEFEIINYNLKSIGTRVHYQLNTSDKVYFPTRGSWLKVDALANFENPMEAQLYINSPDTTFDYTVNGRVQNYLRFNLRVQKNLMFSKKITLQLKGQFGFTQEISSIESRFSAYQLAAGDFIYVGGQIRRPRSNSFTFTGLKEAEVAVPQVMIAGVDLQIALSKNTYLIPSLNILAGGYDSSDFWRSLGDFDFSGESSDKSFYQFGYGISGSYMSLLGPISLTLSNDNEVNVLRWFLSIGFTL